MKKPSKNLFPIIVEGIIVIVIVFVVFDVFMNIESIFTWYKESYSFLDDNYHEVVEDIEIYALQDSTEIRGKLNGLLFVQSGTINQELYYRVMLTDGTKKRYYKLPAETTDIYDIEPDEKPHIRVVWIVKNFWGADDSLEGFSDTVGTIQSISLHVPKGTIDNNFELDLKN